MLCTGEVLADAPCKTLAGLTTGKSQVYDVGMLAKRLLVGEVEN